MKLKINEDGKVFLDDKEIDFVLGVNIEKINPMEGMEVTIRVHVTEADVRWRVTE
ncbi:hypothetical protein [Candidatus Allofournierella excrementavium]|uniref:hypothetical protein n=1 Tax=Candidatus Allofournierella excrementavium TaxID=2838591 RepID=UPI003AB74FBD